MFTGCEKMDDPGPVIGAVRRDGKVSHIRLSSVILKEENLFRFFSLNTYHPKAIYPYGSIVFYNIPLEEGDYSIEPKILDTLSRQYILDSVFCTGYNSVDVDAIVDFFRLIPDHSVNQFRITEVNKTKGRIKGTFSLAFERDPYYIGSLIPDPTHRDTVIFTEGTFNFTYKR